MSDRLFVLVYIVAFTALPWVFWYMVKSRWMRRRERTVLEKKYGDLEMFADRLKEWKILR